MNEQEAEEQGTVLHGVDNALENIARNIDCIAIKIELQAEALQCLKADIRNTAKELQAYFRLQKEG